MHNMELLDTWKYRAVMLIKKLIGEVEKSVINKPHIFKLCKACKYCRQEGCFCHIFCSLFDMFKI